MIAYHITDVKDIKRFTLSKVTSGMGTTFYGYGLYFALDKATCEEYYNKFPKNKDYYIYKVNIADSKIHDEFDKIKDNISALELYAYYVEELGSEEAATKQIVKDGVYGIKYHSQEDGNSVVIYNDKIINVIDYTKCENVL